ncbi:di-trans,poly-cis-decaprenylcistransferase [Patescibacteria group bacterium]|nr:MAG: di-trans,poly-cis-decaprenylcistransferase [Patescibacteria group bacterium]
MTDEVVLPRHIGFIIDGNRRWAKKHGLPAYEGHLAGYDALKDVVVNTANAGVKFISLYTFSTENWNRAKEEVSNLMGLMMRLFKTDVHLLLENDLRLVVLGSRDKLPKKMCDAIDSVERQTAHCQKSTVAVCFNYGGQQEVVTAIKNIIEQKIDPDSITPELITKNLYHPEVPEVDLIVRTSGEKRLSNFMLWRSPYSELLFLDKFWPDMKKADVTDILDEYSKRHRRFGG